MKKYKKSKRNKNKKIKTKEEDDNIINDNAAPFFNRNEEEENDDDEDLAPAIDNQTKDFNHYINDFNKRREGKIEIQLNKNPDIKHVKSKQMKFMRKIYANNLKLDIVHKDCFILLEIKSKLLKAVSQQFYADDENNKRLYISIYNFDKKFSENEFKPGKYIIIKEPYYKIYMDGKIGIRVDNPNDVIIFKNKSEAQDFIIGVIGDIDEYLNIGDKHYENKEYYQALGYYKCSSELDYKDINIKGKIYEKLIKTYLKINAFNLSLQYCDKFLSLYDKTNNDIINYKIKSLINLKKFEESKKFLEENKNILSNELYKLNEEYIKNNIDNSLGKFNLNKIKGGDVSEYLNPKIEFGYDREFKGNMLKAKEDISKGELLIVSKAFYLLTNEKYIKSLKEYYERVNYKRFKEYYFDLYEEFKIEPEYYLYKNLKKQKKISEIDFEKLLDLDDYENWSFKYSERKLIYPNRQTPNLANIANINGIKIYSSIFSCETQGYGYGLWYYPSFLNHSCDPNTLEFGIEDIYFLYAQKNIKKGEEITRRYFNYGLDILNRYANLKGYGFECKCNVCSHQINFLREKNKEHFENFVKQFGDLFKEDISKKEMYNNIKNIEKFINENGTEFNEYDLINFYFRVGYILLNKKINYNDSEKYLNKAYILIKGKNFHFECIILRCLYILYYENACKEKLKNIEDKIDKNLNDFFGNLFLKEKLNDIYKERKNVQLLDELNKKVKYFEDIENNSIKNRLKRLKQKFPSLSNILIISFIVFICFLLDKISS